MKTINLKPSYFPYPKNRQNDESTVKTINVHEHFVEKSVIFFTSVLVLIPPVSVRARSDSGCFGPRPLEPKNASFKCCLRISCDNRARSDSGRFGPRPFEPKNASFKCCLRISCCF